MQEFSKPKLSEQYWEQRWQTKQTGWDIGGPHPHLEALLQLAEVTPPASVWIPGCGRGHDGAALAQLGFKVCATDLSPTAIAEAKQTYPQVSGLEFVVEDLFAPAASAHLFDIIYDRAMLCALPPQRQGEYLKICQERLRPGGKFCSILFSQLSKDVTEGPPFVVDEKRVQSLLGTNGNWKFIEGKKMLPPPLPRVVLEETLFVAERAN